MIPPSLHGQGAARALPIVSALRTYTTTFGATENPISESGAWHANGVDWTTMRTGGGIAYGNQVGSGFDDSGAQLNGTWANNQYTRGVVSITGAPLGGLAEIELRHRWFDDGAHISYGYELTVSGTGDPYVQIIRWPTAGIGTQLSDFTYVAIGSKSGGIADGDIVEFFSVGTLHTAKINGVTICSGTDSAFTAGQPGIGTYGGAGSAYGWKDFYASEL